MPRKAAPVAPQYPAAADIAKFRLTPGVTPFNDPSFVWAVLDGQTTPAPSAVQMPDGATMAKLVAESQLNVIQVLRYTGMETSVWNSWMDGILIPAPECLRHHLESHRALLRLVGAIRTWLRFRADA